VRASLGAPNFPLKIIPHVDGTPRICELVEYYLEEVTVKGRRGPGRQFKKGQSGNPNGMRAGISHKITGTVGPLPVGALNRNDAKYAHLLAISLLASISDPIDTV
jgi:hypothetical protein